jgi:phospholipase C
MKARRSLLVRSTGTVVVAAGALVGATAVPGSAADSHAAARTATPIQHLVVIYQENHSFDNYFGTYPHALNPPVSRPSTPSRTLPR